ncbi:LysR family transcriptional regulator [Amycolatopsis sp. NPDC003865]
MSGPAIETMDLLVFLTVARAGSFGGAAVELQLAQPSVSARMATLERRLGTRLFDRSHRGTTLTPAGERLGAYARRCLELLAETEASVRAEGRERLVVATPASIGNVVFPAVLAAMAGEPVDLVCRIAHSDESVAALLDGSAHAAYVLQRVLPPGLDAWLVAGSPITAVAAPHHPASHRSDLRPEDLLTTPLAVHNWSDQALELAESFTGPQRSIEHPVRLVGAPDVVVDLAVRHGYVAVLPRFAAAQALRRGQLCQLAMPDTGLEVQVRLAHRPEAIERNAIKRLHAATATIAGLIGSS